MSLFRIDPNKNEHIRSTANANTASPINTEINICLNCKINNEKKWH